MTQIRAPDRILYLGQREDRNTATNHFGETFQTDTSLAVVSPRAARLGVAARRHLPRAAGLPGTGRAEMNAADDEEPTRC
jgi:hypothetical protein